MIHAWFANAQGLEYIDDNFQLNIINESFEISTLIDQYKNNPQINTLLMYEETRFIGFEDMFDGGDLDYNDIIFAFRGVSNSAAGYSVIQIPNSSSALLFLCGLIGLFNKLKEKS